MSSDSSTEVVLPLPPTNSFPRSTHVSYSNVCDAYNYDSCGSCGYELNLNSYNRNTSLIDEKYGKSMKRGFISFFSIDESRFTQINKVRWLPYLASKKSWRLFQRRTELLCRNCGNYIGTASYLNDDTSSSSRRFQAVTWDGISGSRTYEIKIRSLRPLSFEGSAFF